MNSILEDGKRVIRVEGKAVEALEGRIGENFVAAVETILSAKGRVVVSGMGKSGIIARKVVATMNSTGTPALFLHASDAVHGDLGMVRAGDVIIVISKSGDTEELRMLMPMFRRLAVKVIAMVGNTSSELARMSDIVIDVSVDEEACPHDLAPTASTTATLAMGDALAVALLQKRKFSKEDFAMIHPGGNLGKQLNLTVGELMTTGERVPRVGLDIPLSEAIMEMTSKRLGATCVVNKEGILAGIITDGDLRRLLQRTSSVSDVTAEQAMSRDPKTIRKELLAAVALEVMEKFKITQLVVVDEGNRPVGMLHMHDLVKAGLAGDSNG